jgi:hypothetical protein
MTINPGGTTLHERIATSHEEVRGDRVGVDALAFGLEVDPFVHEEFGPVGAGANVLTVLWFNFTANRARYCVRFFDRFKIIGTNRVPVGDRNFVLAEVGALGRRELAAQPY